MRLIKNNVLNTIFVSSKRKTVKVNLNLIVLPKTILCRDLNLTKKILILINSKNVSSYFKNITDYYQEIFFPLSLISPSLDAFYIFKIKVKGGGFKAQIKSITLAIAKSLKEFFKNSTIEKRILNKYFIFRMDPRKKERKKYGLKKARKAPQYNKR